MKSKNAEGGNFGAYRNTKKNRSTFFNSFDDSRTPARYQCLNCEAWKPAHKLIPLWQFDQANNRLAVFRSCRACWRSYNRVSSELKQDFTARMLDKIRKASEVTIR